MKLCPKYQRFGLEAPGQRPNAESLTAELERLRKEGERLGLRVALGEIVKAIEKMRG